MISFKRIYFTNLLLVLCGATVGMNAMKLDSINAIDIYSGKPQKFVTTHDGKTARMMHHLNDSEIGISIENSEDTLPIWETGNIENPYMIGYFESARPADGNEIAKINHFIVEQEMIAKAIAIAQEKAIALEEAMKVVKAQKKEKALNAIKRFIVKNEIKINIENSKDIEKVFLTAKTYAKNNQSKIKRYLGKAINTLCFQIVYQDEMVTITYAQVEAACKAMTSGADRE